MFDMQNPLGQANRVEFDGRMYGWPLNQCLDWNFIFWGSSCHSASSYLRVIKFQFCSHILDLRLLRIELPLFVDRDQINFHMTLLLYHALSSPTT